MRPPNYALLFMIILACIIPSIAKGNDFHPNQYGLAQDTLRPTIEYWNISVSVYQGLDFEVSAYIWDSESGVENATLHIRNSTSFEWIYEMIFNGSHYVTAVPALQPGDVYRLQILAFDKAGNSATSYVRTIDLSQTTTSIPEWATFPIVVSSSLTFMLVIIIIAWIIKKRQSEAD